MDDFTTLASAFDLVSDPVVAVLGSTIDYMNPSAVSALGGSLLGQSAAKLFPGHVLCAQSAAYVTAALVGRTRYTIRMTAFGRRDVFVFTPEPSAAGGSLSAAISSMRASLGNLKLAAGSLLRLIPEDAAPAAAPYAGALNHSYYELKRLLTNTGLVQSMADGTLPVSPAEFDLSAMCNRLINDCNGIADGVELRCVCDSALRLCADAQLIEIMLLNLIANSLQNTPEGGTVTLSVHDVGEYMLLRVTDTGKGVDLHRCGTVFAKFRDNLSLGEMPNGPGLGLAIARGVAEEHDGSLIIESRPDVGTTVTAAISKTVAPRAPLRADTPYETSGGRDMVLTQLSCCIPASNPLWLERT